MCGIPKANLAYWVAVVVVVVDTDADAAVEAYRFLFQTRHTKMNI